MKFFFGVVFILVSSYSRVSAQNVRSIEIKADPFIFNHPKGLEKSDLDSAALHIIIYESQIVNFSSDQFYKILNAPHKAIDKQSFSEDFRVECIINTNSGRSDYLLMDSHGFYLYNGNIYYDDKIKKFIFDYIPLFYKE